MTVQTLVTSDQKKQIVRFFKECLDAMALDKPGAQRIIERGNKLQEGFKKLLAQLSVFGQFASEEVPSSYGYLSGYKPKSVAEQVRRLRELFPSLGTVNEKLPEQPLPPHAEGFFVMPRWGKIAPTYNEAVEKVLALLSKTRSGKFTNRRQGKLGPQYLRQHQRTVTMFQKFGEQQKDHDMLVVPAQFGLRHHGRSVRRAREVFMVNECGLGAFAIGIMLLTHPERLQHVDDLWIDCAGDEFASDADGQFYGAPYFGFFVGRLKFGADVVGNALGYYGSASGLLPQ